MRDKAKRQSDTADYIICVAVLIQSALVIFQHILMGIFHIDPEETTVYRVVMTAIPMTIAIILAVLRKPILFIITYLIALSILLFHAVIFPSNLEYILDEGFRFLLPLVLSSALCLITVRDISIVEKSAEIVSWITALFVFIYVFAFLRGRFSIDSYSMGFSYGCLFPMLILYTRGRMLSKVVSIILFFIVLSIGSRGAAFVFVFFVAFDMFRSHNRFRWVAFAAGMLLVLLLPEVISFLGTLGINSRTLFLLNEGNIYYTSGREEIYAQTITVLKDNLYLGLGLFGDRAILGGAYCHNLFLEIFVDYGFFLGTLIILLGIIALVVSYRASSSGYRTMWMIFALSGIFPLMATSSYLIYNPLAILIGYSVLVCKRHNNISDNL